MFILILCFLVIFLSIITRITRNLIIWWRVFLLITLLFVSINKSLNSFRTLVNYFVIQEVLGIIFLFFSSSLLQLLLLSLKIGVAPFHFWIFSILLNIYDSNLLWFLTFQKIPFIFVFFQLFFYKFIIFLFLGLLLCYFQIFLLKNYKFIIRISSTERFNWFLLVLFFSFRNSLFLFLYYFFIILLLLFKVRQFFYGFGNWETVLLFLNIPFSATFFVKIFRLRRLLGRVFFVVPLLFLIFLSSLSFAFWLVYLSTKFDYFLNIKNNIFLFIWLSVRLLCLV